MNYRLICADCGAEAAVGSWICPACAGLLAIAWKEDPAPQPADDRRRGVWRHANLLPSVDAQSVVSLGEGGTPLVWIDRWAARHRLERVALKLESLNPTGSFKDRGTTVVVSVARSLGVTRLVEDSSGNAGASVAAYAARAAIPATVYVPAGAPAAKRAQIERLGATVVPIAGSRSAVTDAALADARASGAFYVGHNHQPLFASGMATFAYELLERRDLGSIDHVVIPTGGGSLLLGCSDGWSCWTAVGTATSRRLPRLHAAQSEGCSPLVAAWERGLDAPPPIERRPTIAGGIEVERPPRGRPILAAIRASGGSAVAVSDFEIRAERQALARLEGIDLEPTSAAALAALARLAQRAAVQPSDTVVVAATGAGWKDPT
jgi:threonine synthase